MFVLTRYTAHLLSEVFFLKLCTKSPCQTISSKKINAKKCPYTDKLTKQTCRSVPKLKLKLDVTFCFPASDEELFEDNPDEYIRRDIEGSDVDTRRRAACDLVKVLSKFFEEKMMTIFGQYVQVSSLFLFVKKRLSLTNVALFLLLTQLFCLYLQ